jgi:hypothetical protein
MEIIDTEKKQKHIFKTKLKSKLGSEPSEKICYMKGISSNRLLVVNRFGDCFVYETDQDKLQQQLKDWSIVTGSGPTDGLGIHYTGDEADALNNELNKIVNEGKGRGVGEGAGEGEGKGEVLIF